MEKIDFLKNELQQDRDFFHNFKEEFIKFFTDKSLQYLDTSEISIPRSLADNVYNLLFLEKENPADNLKHLVKESLDFHLELKPVFSESFLYVLKNYIDYVVSKQLSFEKIKVLVDLLDIYLFIIETAYMEYTKELEKQVNEIKNEKINDELNIILHGIKRIIDAEKEVQVVSFYKGVPVVCKGFIEDLFLEKFIKLQMENCRYKNFYIQNSTVYIKSDEFPSFVKTQVKDADIRTNTIKLKLISFEKVPELKRKYIRVVPEEDIFVKIYTNNIDLIGKITDISIGGCGILIGDLPEDKIKIGDKVKLSFKIKNRPINVFGIVRNINEEGQFYKLGIEFIHKDKSEELISEYVVKRQFEIIKELKI